MTLETKTIKEVRSCVWSVGKPAGLQYTLWH